MIELTDKQQVLDRLAEGHELTNRGTGWWLSKPRTGNQPAVAQQPGPMGQHPGPVQGCVLGHRGRQQGGTYAGEDQRHDHRAVRGLHRYLRRDAQRGAHVVHRGPGFGARRGHDQVQCDQFT